MEGSELNVSFIGNIIHIKFSLIFNNLFGDFKGSITDFFSKTESVLSDDDIRKIQAYNVELGRCRSSQTAFNHTMLDASEAAQDFVANAHGCTVQLDKIPKSSKAAAMGLQALKAAGNMLVGIGISLAVSALIKVLTDLAQAKEKARQAAIESIDTYKQEQSLLEDQIKKYKELTEVIENGNLSVDETVEKKEELLGIQNNLISTFGDEAEGIDLVNGKYQEQLKLLEDISKANSQHIVNENQNKIGEAKAKLEKEHAYGVGYITGWDDNSPLSDAQTKLINFVKSYSDLFQLNDKNAYDPSKDSRTYWTELTVNANVEDADKVLHDFSKDLREFGDENDIDVSSILKRVSAQLDTTKKQTEELADYKKIYDEYATALVMSNDKTRAKYKEAVDAVEAYNKAIATGDGYEDAKSNLASVKASVEELTGSLADSEEYWRVFQQIFGEQERSREERVGDLKAKFGLHHNDKTLETFFASGNIDIERFERIAAVCNNVWEAIRMYRTEVAAAEEDTNAFSISNDQAKALEEYQSKIDSISSSLSDLHNLSASDITSLLTDFSEHADIWEMYGVNEYGEGDIESALEAIAQKLKEETADKVPQMRSYIEGMFEAVLNPKGNSDKLQLEVDSLELILKDVRDGKVLDEVATAKLINQYPELADAVRVLTEGYSFEEDAIIDLTNTKIEAANKAIAWDIEQTEQEIANIRARIQARQVELVHLRKQGIQMATIGANGETQFVNPESDWNELQELLNHLQELKDIYNTNLETLGKNADPEIFDWYATYIERLQSEIDDLGTTIDDVYSTWTNRNNALQNSIGKTEDLIEAQQKAGAEYLSRANKVGLDQSWVEKIQSGAFTIDDLNSVNDANLIEDLQEYIKWYDRYLDMQEQAAANQAELDDKYAQSMEFMRSETEGDIARLEAEQKRIQDQIDLNGDKGTGEQYNQLIQKESVRKQLLEDMLKLEEEYLTKLDPNTEAYAEQESVINDCKDGIAECTKNTKDWGKAILELALDGIQETIDGLNDSLESMQGEMDDMDAVIAGAVAYIQDQIDAQEELKEGIQDQINALQEANDERERALALDKAKYELERAQSQRVKKVYKGEGKGFVYEADQDAVRDARENLSNLEFEETIHVLEKQIKYYDDIIEDLQEIKDAWGNIKQEAEDTYNINLALGKLGEDGIFDISQIEAYSKAYNSLNDAMKETEDRIESWEEFKKGLNEIVEKYEFGGYSSLMDAKAAMRDYAQDYLYGQEEYNVYDEYGQQDPDLTMANVNKAVAKILDKYWDAFEVTQEEFNQNLESIVTDYGMGLYESLDSAKEAIRQEAIDYLGQKDDYFIEVDDKTIVDQEKLQADADKIVQTYEEKLNQAKANVAETNDENVSDTENANEEIKGDTEKTFEEIAAELQKAIAEQKTELEKFKGEVQTLFVDVYKTVNDGLISGFNAFSDKVSESCGLLAEQLAGLENQLNGVDEDFEVLQKKSRSSIGSGLANRTAVQLTEHHTGLKKGLVGEKDAGEGLKKIGLRKLEPDEIPEVLQVGEAVLTKLQQQNVMSNLGTAYRAGVNTSVIKNDSSTPVVQNISLTLPNVTNEGGYNRLVQELQGLQLEALQYSKRR